MDKVWEELWLSAAAYLLVGAGAVVLLIGCLLAAPYTLRRPLPVRRLRPGRWGGSEVVLTVLVALFVAPFLVNSLLQSIVPADELKNRETALRLEVYSSPLELVLILALITALLFVRTRTRPHHYGLTLARAPANVALGAAAFLVLAPVTLGLYFLATLAFGTREHPFERLLAQNFPAWAWIFLVFMTVVRAPLVEEVVFRGILQGWLRRASVVGHAALLTTIVILSTLPLAAYFGENKDAQAIFGGESLVHAAAFLAFAVLLVAGYVVWFLILELRPRPSRKAPVMYSPAEGVAPETPEAYDHEAVSPPRVQQHDGPPEDERRDRPAWAQARLAIYGSAILFAVFHFRWPDPAPLFVLGLGLGWLAYRTQSLIGPIVCHGLFNAVACLVLYWGGGAP